MAREIAFDPHNRQQMLGLVGSVLAALGVFAPLVSVPFLGHLTYFQNGQGDGVIVLLCAGVGVVLSLFRNFKGTLGAGLASVALLAFTFIRIQMKMAEMQAEMQQKLAGNPFRGLAEATMGSIQFEWGWGVLVVGGGLMVASGLVGSAGGRRSCPHCAKLVLLAASMCRFCGRAVDPVPDPGLHSGATMSSALTDMTECPRCHEMMAGGAESCVRCRGRLHDGESRLVPVRVTTLKTHAMNAKKKIIEFYCPQTGVSEIDVVCRQVVSFIAVPLAVLFLVAGLRGPSGPSGGDRSSLPFVAAVPGPRTPSLAIAPPHPVDLSRSAPIAEPDREPVVASASASGEELISLDVKGAEVVNLLRILAAESGRNIVSGDDVKGRVSVSLKNVTWVQALDTILEASDLSKVERDGVIFVGPKSRK